MLIFTKQAETVLKNLEQERPLQLRDNELEIVEGDKFLGLQKNNSLG